MDRGMIDRGKRNILGILMNALDYEAAVDFVIRAARERRGAAVSALTVHGLMTEASARQHKYRLNHFGLLVPEGHPVRWAMDDWFNLIPLAATLYIGYSIIAIRKGFRPYRLCCQLPF
jgi:UDP-N-acetyl-D-mannosaminuronic acid transferase (WecB/TagA/CpsF family)